MFGGARPYVTRRSCENQFYSDLVTPLPEGISAPGTTIHVFYAEKMGKKYLARYRKHFRDPVIYPQDLQHEELLACPAGGLGAAGEEHPWDPGGSWGGMKTSPHGGYAMGAR